MSARAALIWLSTLLPLLGGCTRMGSARPDIPQGPSCNALYEKVDRMVEEAGVADSRFSRIADFPYLRSDRFTASFAREIPDMEAFWEWAAVLRANEDEARDLELRNLNLPAGERALLLLELRGCGAWLRTWELEDPVWREKLLTAVQPPDDYSLTARTLGAYPLAAPFLRAGVERFHRGVLKDYARPVEQLESRGEPVLWSVRPGTQENSSDPFVDDTIDLRTKPRDLLGRIGLLWTEVGQLAQYHAPAFLIDTAGDYDRLGAPAISADGMSVDTRLPIVYFLSGYTRFGGRNLMQISYFLWFSERPPQHAGDAEAGRLDGLIWRVTLDEQGRALMHDSIHACGCYHYGYAPAPLRLRDDASKRRSSILFPQAEVPAGPVAVRVQSGTHAVQRVLARDQVRAAKTAQYDLRPYEDLMLLDRPGGGTQSLFGPDGFIAGSERSERRWLWPSGVRNAGAMRQWGRHATAFTGRAHFDDPFLMDEVFEARTQP